jgi:hypothetical protein
MRCQADIPAQPVGALAGALFPLIYIATAPTGRKQGAK